MNEIKAKPFQFSLRALLVFVTVCAVIFGVLRIVYDRTFGMVEVAKDAYALEQAVALLKVFMATNDGAWPTCWNDLKKYQKEAVMYGGSDACTFDEVQSRVEIDFHTNPMALVKTSNQQEDVQFHVLWLRSGIDDHYWKGCEPNHMLQKFIVSKFINNESNRDK